MTEPAPIRTATPARFAFLVAFTVFANAFSAPAKTGTGSDHWAFKAPVRRELPSTKDPSWNATPVDNFVAARLEKEGLRPSPEADRQRLVRRLFLNLTGLPPKISDIDAFLADTEPGAGERLVERLLASPHFGERWARVWLDAARYADSDGFEKDKPRDVWLYRDWVINAFNADMPYNQFVIEQIAGDLLPNATQSERVATGFLRNSMINEEGGVHPEQFRMEAMFDRMDAIGKSVLGLTIQCAQCHDHKFDPISQEEYYRMFAYINDSSEGSMVAYGPDALSARARILGGIHAVENTLKHETPDWEQRLDDWAESMKAPDTQWHPLQLSNAGENAQRYYEQNDGSLLAAGYAPTRFTEVFTNTIPATDIRAFRLEVMTDPNLPSNGPGRSLDGQFVLSEFKVEARSAADPSKKRWAKWKGATADFANGEKRLGPPYSKGRDHLKSGPVAFAIDGDNQTGWGIDAGPGRRNTSRKAVFRAEGNIAFEGGTKLSIHLGQQHGGPNSDQNQNLNLGRFRVSWTDNPDAVADPVPMVIRAILDTPGDRRSPMQKAELFSYWRTTVPEWKAANDRIEALWKQHPEGTTQLVLHRLDQGRETQMLKRGDFLKPAGAVEPGVPAALNKLPDGDPSSRLTFARWMVARDSPTTARSIVNRIWQAYFGRGLVATSEDLGTRAPEPTHPELLDWLAVELMEPTFRIGDEELRPWSLKHIHRLIVNSSTFRQSSAATKNLIARDAYNDLLARGPRFRVDAEIVRDIALAAGGLLNPEVGGPSVYPPAPRFLFDPPVSYGPKYWGDSKGGDKYRRALYTFRYRSVPYPALLVYDAPNGDASCVRRSRSNTPLQALVSLNEPLFMECAQALAHRTLETVDGGPLERIRYAFRTCVGREPSIEEADELSNLLRDQEEHIAEGWVDTKTLAGLDDDRSPPENTTPARLAAWTTVARVLLNLDETISTE